MWKTSDQIVTSLHAIPTRHGITVECAGAKKKAEVIKTLAKADLALLRLAGNGGQFPESCVPITSFVATKPESGSGLWTYGYNSGARSGTSKYLIKGSASFETLQGLLNPSVLKQVKDFGIPDPDLDIYFVQGGAAPGYSGAPVVDKGKNLVGIVDGGLDRGLSDYNWLIPAANLDALLTSDTNELPDQLANGNLFSTITYDSDASRVIEYEHEGRKFSWVWTKTRSLAEIASTADAEEGIDEFLDTYYPVGIEHLVDRLVFDIYQEKSSGILIAIPEGAGLIQNDRGELILKRHDPALRGNVIYKSSFKDVLNRNRELVEPKNADFFRILVNNALKANYWEGETSALPFIQVLDDEQGNKILRFITQKTSPSSRFIQFSFRTIVVRNNTAFGVEVQFSLYPGECVFGCGKEPVQLIGHMGGVPSMLKHLELIVSTNLVTLSNFDLGFQYKDVGQLVIDEIRIQECLNGRRRNGC
jgi:hypothetical protein